MIGAHFRHVVWVGVVTLSWEQNGRGRRVKVVFDLAVHLALLLIEKEFECLAKALAGV